MASAPLSDPQFSDDPDLCVRCGYSLAGLTAPGVCPECGLPFESPMLTLSGVTHANAGVPPIRRIAWVVVGVLTVMVSQWTLFGFLHLWGMLAIAFVSLVAIVPLLLLTGPSDRRGVERFVLSAHGIARLSVRRDDANSQVFIPWGAQNRAEIKRIGAFWSRLRLTCAGKGADWARTTLLDAGFRCPDAEAERVRHTINTLLERANSAAERLAPPTVPQVR